MSVVRFAVLAFSHLCMHPNISVMCGNTSGNHFLEVLSVQPLHCPPSFQVIQNVSLPRRVEPVEYDEYSNVSISSLARNHFTENIVWEGTLS